MKKVKVKIAVAVDKDGSWNAHGWSGYDNDDEARYQVTLDAGSVNNFYWIEAELPIPEETVIHGDVIKDSK